MCVYAYICVNTCICTWMYVYLRYCLTRWGVVVEIFYLWIGVLIYAYAYVCACMRAYVYVHMYVYVYKCVCVYVCIYMYIHMRVGVHMHSCRRMLFVCTVQFLYYMRVHHGCFLKTCMHVWAREGIGSSSFFPACPWLALVAGVGGYVLAGVEIGVLSCIFLYFGGWWVGVCL